MRYPSPYPSTTHTGSRNARDVYSPTSTGQGFFGIKNSVRPSVIIEAHVNAEELAVWLEQRLPSELDLDAATTRVTHILNWGGFVNHSFFVRDAHRRYHLKLTPSPDSARLRQWYELGAILSARYRAPAVLRWIEFPEIALAGLLLEHLD